MGRRGPKPEPASVKIAKGNPSKRPIGVDPDEAGNGQAESSRRIAAPGWLNESGREVWDRIAPRQAGLKLLTQTDAETFARYCMMFADWIRSTEEIDRDGRWYKIETASGEVRRQHPLLGYVLRINRELMAFEAQFGLNPAERQRIFAARAAGASPSGDLFQATEAEKGAQQIEPSQQRAGPSGAIGFLN